MAAGLSSQQYTLASINLRAGSLVDAFIRTLQDIHIFKTQFLDGHNLQTEFSFTSGDEATLKSAFTDLEQLYQIYIGAQNLTNVKDFTAFTKQVRGLP